MDQSSSCAAESSVASQEFPRNFWNPDVHYHTHKCLSPVPNAEPQQSSPLSPSQFFKFHFNIMFPSTPWSSRWYIFVGISYQYPLCISSVPHPCHILFISRPSCFVRVKNLWYRFQIIMLLVM
jgi:hypothetical protein